MDKRKAGAGHSELEDWLRKPTPGQKTLIRNHDATVKTPDGVTLYVDIYPVGVLQGVQASWRRKRYRIRLGDVLIHIWEGNWRTAKNCFNGYLAEPNIFPGKLTRCGSGWTRKRALKDLQRRVDKA